MLNRNHATCIHAVKTYHTLYETSKEFRGYADEILAHIGTDRMEGHKKSLLDALEAIEKERTQILQALNSF